MHVILKKHTEEIAKQFELDENESTLFEIYCNYCVVSKSFLGRFNPSNVTTKEDDASIDGLAFIIDGELILSEDDAIQAFDTHKTGLNTKLIITQSKSGERFVKDEIANFGSGIKDFLSLDPKLPNGEVNQEALRILNIILDNLNKVANKLPDIEIYYCTSGVYSEEREIVASFEIIDRDVKSIGIFKNVLVEPLGRNELIKIWNSINSSNEAKIHLQEYFGIPEMPNIPQSYIALINAREFVDKLLRDENGNIKNEVFEENIRAFLGETPVNNKIKSTLEDSNKKKIFSVLNNGITIVTPELTLTPNSKEIHLKNYQIINGCQTSNTLFYNYEYLNVDTNIVVKCIESTNEEYITEIISATNSQTEIPKESFFSLKEKTKQIQSIFTIQNDSQSSDNKIYFERRENEYKQHNHQQSRVFDIKLLCRAYNAMFLDQPHNSARYVAKIFEIQGENLFKETDQEISYYIAALTHYKLNSLINSKKLDANTHSALRWHVLFIFKHLVHGEIKNTQPNSKGMSRYCEKILQVLTCSNKRYEQYFQESFDVINSIPYPSKDVLKRAKYQSDLLEATRMYLESKKHLEIPLP